MPDFHKPVRRPGDVIETLIGGGDPAEDSELAHDSAAALLGRVRGASDPALVDRVIAYADEHGIDDVAELWAVAPAETLPGAMWRIYLLRHTVVTDPDGIGYQFRRGLEVEGGPNRAIAGSSFAPTPQEVADLSTTILRGAFTGDFAVALERGSAFARVMWAGLEELANGDQERSADHRKQAAGFATMADHLHAAAKLWREGQLR